LQELSPEYSALEIRQEKILNQLAELKKQVSTLCSFLKRSNKIAIKRTGAPINTKVRNVAYKGYLCIFSIRT